MEETAKTMGLSEASTTKVREYFKKAYECMKEKGDYLKKTDEEKKKFMEESVVAIQAEVDEAEKELVSKVVFAAYVSLIAVDLSSAHSSLFFPKIIKFDIMSTRIWKIVLNVEKNEDNINNSITLK